MDESSLNLDAGTSIQKMIVAFLLRELWKERKCQKLTSTSLPFLQIVHWITNACPPYNLTIQIILTKMIKVLINLISQF